MNLTMRATWIGASALVCAAATQGLVGRLAVTVMFIGSWFIGDDE